MNQNCFLLSFKQDYPTQTQNPGHILTQIWHKCLYGCVCFAAINITRARFSGSDEFGYTSFMAYSSLPSLSFFYEFKLQFTLTSNSSAMKDNLMMFAGHKGQGEIQFRQQENSSEMPAQLDFSCQTLSRILKDRLLPIWEFPPAVFGNVLSNRFHSHLWSANQENYPEGLFLLADFQKWIMNMLLLIYS